MTRETVRDTPQYYIMRLSSNGSGPQLRQLSDYPHPYPSLRDLQKEVIRHAPLLIPQSKSGSKQNQLLLLFLPFLGVAPLFLLDFSVGYQRIKYVL